MDWWAGPVLTLFAIGLLLGHGETREAVLTLLFYLGGAGFTVAVILTIRRLPARWRCRLRGHRLPVLPMHEQWRCVVCGWDAEPLRPAPLAFPEEFARRVAEIHRRPN
jgi:hypothetical protein